MELSDAIKHRIDYFLKKKGLSSLWDLYKTSGVPKSTINALLGTQKINYLVFQHYFYICEGLDTTLMEFLMILCL